jgi:hypothetical protein
MDSRDYEPAANKTFGESHAPQRIWVDVTRVLKKKTRKKKRAKNKAAHFPRNTLSAFTPLSFDAPLSSLPLIHPFHYCGKIPRLWRVERCSIILHQGKSYQRSFWLLTPNSLPRLQITAR